MEFDVKFDVKTKRLKLHSMLPFMPWDRMDDELIDHVFDYEGEMETPEHLKYTVGEIRSAIAHYTMCLNSIQGVREQLGLRVDPGAKTTTLDRKDILRSLKEITQTINADRKAYVVFSLYEDGIAVAKTHILSSFRTRLEKAYAEWLESNKTVSLRDLLERESVRNLPGLGWRSV